MNGAVEESTSTEEHFTLFNGFLSSLTEALGSLDSGHVFKNIIAKSSRKINVMLQAEGENFGMTQAIYDKLVIYARNNRLEYKNLLALGDFYFEERSNYFKMMIVVTVGNGVDINNSHVPAKWLPEVLPEITPENLVGQKRKVYRGPGTKEFKSASVVTVSSKLLTENIEKVINDTLIGYSISKQQTLINASIQNIQKRHLLDGYVNNDSSVINNKIVQSLKEYLFGLQKYGGKYDQIHTTLDNILTAISVKDVSNVDMSATLGVNRKRFTTAKLLKKSVDDLIEIAKKKESVTLLDDEIKATISYDSSEVDVYNADYDSDDKSSDESSESTVGEESVNENRNATYSENDKSVENNKSVENCKGVEKESVKKNIFYSVLSPKEKKTRLDKLDLSIVRDFCHEKCRLDTFASSQVFVHNYDGTHSYHQIHVKSQSLMQYYLL